MNVKERAFTLVEILIVVIILGILAAVIIPQFSSATDDTRQSSVMTDLRTIRAQIGIYRTQHEDINPDNFVNQVTLFTDLDGNTQATLDSTFRFGPYLLAMPKNPYTGKDTVTTVTGAGTTYTPAADLNQGWWYNSDSGEFRCHVPDSVMTADGTSVNLL